MSDKSMMFYLNNGLFNISDTGSTIMVFPDNTCDCELPTLRVELCTEDMIKLKKSLDFVLEKVMLYREIRGKGKLDFHDD